MADVVQFSYMTAAIASATDTMHSYHAKKSRIDVRSNLIFSDRQGAAIVIVYQFGERARLVLRIAGGTEDEVT